jgi:hypothetical protein
MTATKMQYKYKVPPNSSRDHLPNFSSRYSAELAIEMPSVHSPERPNDEEELEYGFWRSARVLAQHHVPNKQSGETHGHSVSFHVEPETPEKLGILNPSGVRGTRLTQMPHPVS